MHLNYGFAGRSIWNVMRSHVDFAEDRNPPMDLPEPPPTNFKFTKFFNA